MFFPASSSDASFVDLPIAFATYWSTEMPDDHPPLVIPIAAAPVSSFVPLNMQPKPTPWGSPEASVDALLSRLSRTRRSFLWGSSGARIWPNVKVDWSAGSENSAWVLPLGVEDTKSPFGEAGGAATDVERRR